MSLVKVTEGWGRMWNYPQKWHYFVDKKSLCSKYVYLGTIELEQGNDDSSDNCAACKKKLSKRKANA